MGDEVLQRLKQLDRQLRSMRHRIATEIREREKLPWPQRASHAPSWLTDELNGITRVAHAVVLPPPPGAGRVVRPTLTLKQRGSIVTAIRQAHQGEGPEVSGSGACEAACASHVDADPLDADPLDADSCKA
jgi:hypothetical protein